MKGELFKKICKKELTIGSWITLSDMGLAEIMARSGFDWLAIDMEHSALTLDHVQDLIRIIELCGVSPLVRVGHNAPELIKRVMDAGSHGVIVPMVNSHDDAKRAVDAVRYPPDGTRGVGLARAQGYGLAFDEYKRWMSICGGIVIVQIEHIQAIENLREILSTEGVNASIIGPYDLSASLGYPGAFERNDVKAAIKEYSRVSREMKKPAGFHVIPPNAKDVRKKIAEGFKFISFSLDTLFIGEKIRDEIKILKGKHV